ncbi:lipid-A-disaccharide synthase [Rhodobacteraceae bacterium RKSG542]|uniref:lipid-A-disaccharide synthase n=1 Tax=Pseudovibrio flavus TaxID=2529854 RepID=UPI0012BC8455|nr:lipid-A-disaccharide synthase [Pseudovibrio flavus]MTI16657.1 lipid-A-disaccharide synthase [Pseudovibrio flavus]
MTAVVKPTKLYFVVGEESGDQLGAELIKALKPRLGGALELYGVGGERMAAQGVNSLFPLEDIAVMGITAVLARLPSIVKRVYQTVDDVIAVDPDVLVIIDSPDFTHNVAKRVRKKAPHIKVVDYVSPSVWAWRSGRAKKMSAYVDELLALLPFEPAIHEKLGGPHTTYVGHPLIERLDDLRPRGAERGEIGAGNRRLLVLPGSRSSEVSRLMEPFGAIVANVKEQLPDVELLLPVVPHQKKRVLEHLESWPVKPVLVEGEQAKFEAFRSAHAALAASGTVSLELAVSGVPSVVAYKLDWFLRRIKDIHRVYPIASVDTMVLPNLILKEKVMPEFLDDDVTVENIAPLLCDLLQDTPARAKQLEGLKEIDDAMQLPEGKSQAGAAADVVLNLLSRS